MDRMGHNVDRRSGRGRAVREGMMGRKRTKPEPEFPQVLIRNCRPHILDHEPFDAGSIHARIDPGGDYVIWSFNDEIARWKNETDEWHMFFLVDCSKTTRYHLAVVNNAINHLLYNGHP